MVLVELSGKIDKFKKAIIFQTDFASCISRELTDKSRLTYDYLISSGEGLRRNDALDLYDDLMMLREKERYQTPSMQKVLDVLINELFMYNRTSIASPQKIEEYIGKVVDRLLILEDAYGCIIRNERLTFNNFTDIDKQYQNIDKLRAYLQMDIEHLLNTGYPIKIDFTSDKKDYTLVISMKKTFDGKCFTDDEGNAIINLKTVPRETPGSSTIVMEDVCYIYHQNFLH